MKCIYCGDASGLSDEHIVPDGLGGKNVLRNASCQKHRDITSKFELKIMRGHWMSFRINAKLIKRINRHDRSIYATKIIGDYRERLKVLPKEYPILMLPVFDVVGWPNELPMDVVPYAKTMQQVANPGFRNHVGPSYAGLETKIEYTVNFSVDDFIRFATKIAYCQCFAEYGERLSPYGEILRAIDGDLKGAMRWFQWSPINFQEFNNDATVCRAVNGTMDGVAYCDISFWAILQKSVPVYRIFVGEIK